MQRIDRLTFFAASLSALAGYVDAVGFMHLGGYFISFMSGNSTRFAVALAGSHAEVALQLAGIILLFVLGTMTGVWIRHFSPKGYATVCLLGYITALLLCAAISAEMRWVLPATIPMVLAMGAENTILQREGETMVPLTYMTGALVKIGQRLGGAVLGGAKLSWLPPLLLWSGLVAGGIAGASAFALVGLKSLWFAAIWAAVLMLVACIFRRRLAT